MKSIAALLIAAHMALLPHPALSADMLSVAQKYVGMSERKHRKALKTLTGVDPRLTKWCGAAMALFARQAGYKPPGSHNIARSWAKFGKPIKLKQVKRGDVVVMRGHVTLFTRMASGKVCGIGGNQSNAVQESCYSTSRVIAVRRAK